MCCTASGCSRCPRCCGRHWWAAWAHALFVALALVSGSFAMAMFFSEGDLGVVTVTCESATWAADVCAPGHERTEDSGDLRGCGHELFTITTDGIRWKGKVEEVNSDGRRMVTYEELREWSDLASYAPSTALFNSSRGTFTASSRVLDPDQEDIVDWGSHTASLVSMLLIVVVLWLAYGTAHTVQLCRWFRAEHVSWGAEPESCCVCRPHHVVDVCALLAFVVAGVVAFVGYVWIQDGTNFMKNTSNCKEITYVDHDEITQSICSAEDTDWDGLFPDDCHINGMPLLIQFLIIVFICAMTSLGPFGLFMLSETTPCGCCRRCTGCSCFCPNHADGVSGETQLVEATAVPVGSAKSV